MITWNFVFLFVWVFTSASVVKADKSPEIEREEREGACTYSTTAEGKQYKFINTEQNYDTSSSLCEADNARLAVILTKDDQIAVARYLVASGNSEVGEAYIGLKKNASNPLLHTWITGESFTFDENTGYVRDELGNYFEYFKDDNDKGIDFQGGLCVTMEDFDEDIFTWEEAGCDEDHYVICECPA